MLEDHSNAPLALAGVRVIDVPNHTVIAELDTDGQGRFQSPPLKPGEYRLEISRANFLDTTVRVQLTDADRTLTARLIRRVAFSGQVTDRQGAPMPGVFVFAIPKPRSGSPSPPHGNTSVGGSESTDQQGKYRLYGLAPGDYLIAASYGASTVAVGQSGSATVKAGIGSGAMFYPDSSQPQVFTVAGGEDLRNINFSLGQSLLFNVSGTVDLPFKPFQVWLALTPVGLPTLATAVAQAKADGTFLFEGVPAGQYNLFAAGPASGRNSQGTFLGDKPHFSRSVIGVAGQNVEGLAVTLTEGRTAAISVQGECGRSVTSVKVQISAMEDWAAVLGQTLDVAIGHNAKALNLAPAKYRLSVQQKGCSQVGDAILDLTGAADSASMTVAATGSIQGHVRASTGDVAVGIVAADGTGVLRIAAPDEKGHFEFEDMVPGRYRMSLRTASGPAYPSLAVGPGKAKEIEVRGGTPTEVELQ